MHLLTSALSLAIMAGSVLAQSTDLTYLLAGSNLTAGSNVTVQVGMGGYPENIDVVAIVIGLMQCPGGECFPATSCMGTILYQGSYNPIPGNYFENYTVTIPQSFITGPASLNVINLFMVGAEYEPNVDYVSQNVTVVA